MVTPKAASLPPRPGIAAHDHRNTQLWLSSLVSPLWRSSCWAPFFTFVSGSGLVVKAYFPALFVAGLVALWLRRRGAPAAEAPWPVRARRAVVSLCLVLAAGLAATVLANWVAIRPPTQADFASWLREHRAELERMREIVDGDQFGAHGAEYGRLLRATGCQGANVWSDGSVSFGYRSWGMANQGWRATLVWSPKQPSPLLPSIDGFPATKVPGSDRAFGRLDGSRYAHIVW